MFLTGGTVGGLTAAYLAQNKFRSVADVIRNDLTAAQRERLSNSVMVCMLHVLNYLKIICGFNMYFRSTAST